jgi:hypothetical protein
MNKKRYQRKSLGGNFGNILKEEARSYESGFFFYAEKTYTVRISFSFISRCLSTFAI